MKVTVTAPANIAFIKYWGQANHRLFVPLNNSISMTLSGCMTTTTVETSDDYNQDLVIIKFHGQDEQNLKPESTKAIQVYSQISRIRKLANSRHFVRVKSENNFPSDAGIASSASGFCALTAALLLAYGLDDRFEDKEELSRQVRLGGSGSAVRSVYGGFVEWLAGHDHQSSYAVQLADEQHWDLVDLVAVVDAGKKLVSSSEGHQLADTSPYFSIRLAEMPVRIKLVKEAIKEKDLEKLGLALEQESISMHTVMMTSQPPLFYWSPGSIGIMQEVRRWREEDNLSAYVTFDAGANAHVICAAQDVSKVQKKLEANQFVKWVIENFPCAGVKRK